MKVSYLRLKREQANLTQKHVAKLLNVDKSLISKVENYKANLSKQKAQEYCKILNISYEEYLDAIENKRYYIAKYVEE